MAAAIFGFFSYVRNVKPEARLVYYLVRARARRARAPLRVPPLPPPRHLLLCPAAPSFFR